MAYDIKSVMLPDARITGPIFAIYRELFGDEEVVTVRDIFDGGETAFACDMLFYAADETGNIHGTALATQSCKLPFLGTLNGVGVLPQARGQKIAERCCRSAVEWLDEQSVRASFLGTGNPHAAHLYEKLGYHFVSGTSLMVRFRENGDDIYRFFQDLYPGGDGGNIESGDAKIRQTIIPLVLACRNQFLDPVNGLFEYPAVLYSCQGLYPRYSALPAAGGSFFCINNSLGALAVLGSLRMSGTEDCFINVIAHEKYQDAACLMWNFLKQKAMDCSCRAHTFAAVNNSEQQSMLTGLGLNASGDKIFEFGNLHIPYRKFTLQN